MEYKWEKDLASAIITQAIYDLRNLRNKKTQNEISEKELKDFFQSEYFEFLCEVINLSSRVILRAIKV